MSKLPFMKFFPGDWLSEPGLRTCSFEARGVWIDMISLMWRSIPRGRLKGTYRELAMMLGTTEKILVKNVNELASNKVLSFRLSGDVRTLINRRMNREEKLRNNKNLRNQKYYGNKN